MTNPSQPQVTTKDFMLRFKLPEGAIFGGCKHLGNGVFVGEPTWAQNSKTPAIVEVFQTKSAPPQVFRLEAVERKTSEQSERGLLLAEYIHNGERKTELELANLAGVSDSEFRNATRQHVKRATESAEMVERLQQELSHHKEALLRLRRWGSMGEGYSAEEVMNISQWIDAGMEGPLPPYPEHYPPIEYPFADGDSVTIETAQAAASASK